jgi:hypothetical protein
MTSLRTSWAFGLFSIGLAGCGSLIGLDDFVDAKPGSTTSGAGGASTTSTAGGGTGGAGGGSTSAGGTGGASPTGGAGGTGGASTSQGGTGGTGGTSPTGGAGGVGGVGGGSTSQGGTGGTGGASTTSTGSGGSGGSSPQCGLQDQPCCANDSCVGQLLGCSDGTCKCTGLVCNGSCADPTSVDSCGTCENKCDPATEYCSDSSCLCQNGERCGGACTDTKTDPSNCGGCGTKCGDNMECRQWTCVCAPPFDICQGACVDTKNDSANCGACGHDCLGGGCLGGACQPITLEKNLPSSPRAITANGKNIYWLQGDEVRMMQAGGGSITSIASAQTASVDIVADLKQVYWTNKATGRIWKADADGTNLEEFRSDGAAGSPNRIAMDSYNVYWTNPFGVRMASRTNQYDPTAWVAQEPIPSSLDNAVAADDNKYVYWVHGGTLRRRNLSAAVTTEVAATEGYVPAMAIANGNLYWARANMVWVMRANLDGSNLTQVGGGANGVGALVAMGDDVYWTFQNQIKSTLAGNNQGRVVLGLPDPPVRLAIDAKAIYWTTQSSIQMVAR